MSTDLAAPLATPDAALRRAADSGPMVPVRYVVRDRRTETSDCVTLVMEPVDEPLATFAPGQFAMLYAFGIGEIPISISALTGDDTLVHTIRSVGPVSRALCGYQPGAMLGVRGPYGTSWGAEDGLAADVVVLAGGLGLAPLRPVVHQLVAERSSYRQVAVLVGARSPDQLLFRDEWDAWSTGGLELAVTVDSASGGWSGDVGVVTELVPTVSFDPGSTLGLICGPEVMMRFAARSLISAGVPADRIRISMERNMKCAIVHCGHCQFGPEFVCRDGAVFDFARVAPLLAVREV